MRDLLGAFVGGAAVATRMRRGFTIIGSLMTSLAVVGVRETIAATTEIWAARRVAQHTPNTSTPEKPSNSPFT